MARESFILLHPSFSKSYQFLVYLSRTIFDHMPASVSFNFFKHEIIHLYKQYYLIIWISPISTQKFASFCSKAAGHFCIIIEPAGWFLAFSLS